MEFERLEDLVKVSCGRDEYGAPRSGGSLCIVDIHDPKHPETIEESELYNASFDIRIKDGCAAIIVDFPLDSSIDFEKTRSMINQWQSVDQKEKLLNLLIVPLVLCGEVIFTFHDLAYADGYEHPSGFFRMIFCFNNLTSSMVVAEDVDYDTIVAAIEEELRHIHEQLEEEIIETEEELHKLEEQNSYDAFIKEKYLSPEKGKEQKQ